MGRVDEAVEDGVGDGRVGDHIVPAVDWQLAGDDGAGAAVAVVDDLQDVAALLVVRPGPARPQSSRIKSCTRARLFNCRAWRPSPRASASASSRRGTRQ